MESGTIRAPPFVGLATPFQFGVIGLIRQEVSEQLRPIVLKISELEQPKI